MFSMRGTERGPLDWLHERRDKDGNPLISDEEFNAGERLRTDFDKAQMQPHVTASWSGLPTERRRQSSPGAHMELQDYVMAAQDRVRRALRAVGTEHANVLVDVCCLEARLTNVEKAAGWPQRSGKVVLQHALRQLARHYGLLPKNTPNHRGIAFIQHWGDGNYRPSMASSDEMDGSSPD